MILDDIATYIAAQSTAFSVFSGTTGNLGKALMLDKVHLGTMTSLYETAGFPNLYAFSTTNKAARVAELPRIQALSRSTSYQTARNNIDVIYQLLDGFSGPLPTSTGTEYLSIEAVQPPFSAGRDENDRWILSVNFDTWRAA